MKKYLYLTAAAAAMLCMTACSDDNGPDDDDSDGKKAYQGAYVLCQGNQYNKIPGNLNLIDYATTTVSNDLFSLANNGMSLGDTPQCGVAYGSKIYVGVSMSSTIQIMNCSDYKYLKTITLPVEGVEGTQPRSMVAHKGKIYISMYDGYVARLDTLTLQIDKSVKVGPNPEIMALRDEKLYVPNSFGMAYMQNLPYGKTASVVDIATMTVTTTFDVPENPKEFINTTDGLYLLCNGNYSDAKAALYKVDKDLKCTEVAKAAMAAAGDDKIYIINQDYYSEEQNTYFVYDFSTKKVTPWEIKKPDYPSGLAYDKANKKILVSSYVMNGEYPSYDLPGYVNVYETDNSFSCQYFIGAGPTCFFFHTK